MDQHLKKIVDKFVIIIIICKAHIIQSKNTKFSICAKLRLRVSSKNFVFAQINRH